MFYISIKGKLVFKKSIWCDGCGEMKRKCYCDEVCDYCNRKTLECNADDTPKCIGNANNPIYDKK